MGCCKSKQSEAPSSAYPSVPEASSLKHPMSGGNNPNVHQDAEANKKVESPQPNPAAVENKTVTKTPVPVPALQPTPTPVHQTIPAKVDLPKPNTVPQPTPAPIPQSKPAVELAVKKEEKPAPAPTPTPALSTSASNLKKLMDILNDIRTNPKKYSERIQTIYLNNMDQRGLNRVTRVLANEGLKAYKESKEYLENQAKPMPALKLDDGLTAAAYLHSIHMAKKGQLDHTGANNSQPHQRVMQMGSFGMSMAVAENILNRREFDAEQFILDFVVDDGVPNRGHRKNIFTDKCHLVGLGLYRENANSDYYFTMDFACNTYKFHEKDVTADIRKNSGLNDFYNSN